MYLGAEGEGLGRRCWNEMEDHLICTTLVLLSTAIYALPSTPTNICPPLYPHQFMPSPLPPPIYALPSTPTNLCPPLYPYQYMPSPLPPPIYALPSTPTENKHINVISLTLVLLVYHFFPEVLKQVHKSVREDTLV